MNQEGTRTLSALLAAAEAHHPHRVALIAPDGARVTYAELTGRVARIGAFLRSAAIGRSDRVAVVLENGTEMALTFLGVAAHAICAPLNPASGVELERSLADLRARLVITGDEHAAGVARRLGIAVTDVSALAGGSGRAPDGAHPDYVALVLSTSGTTSRPKVVPLTQANLCASAANVASELCLTSGDRCLNVMPLFHIHGLVAGLLATLVAGGSVICAPGFDPSRVAGWIDELEPTWYTAVPTMHQALLGVWRDRPRPASLRLIRSSSAALPLSTIADLERVFGVPVIESYGMTEAAHQIASNPLPPDVRKPGSVGRPAGPALAIIAADGTLLPPGQPGEVAIRGASVTPGYADDEAANEAAFTKDGWFRTGDEGVLDEDGYLTISGRLKEIINRGGEKVSPREVDDVLAGHPAVAQAVAFAVPHRTLGEDVAAAVVLHPGREATTRELREFAAARLAPFKVPRQVLLLDALPKGPTGKIQRIGLADMLGVGRDSPPPSPPRTPLEAAVADLWALVLGVDRVGIDDDFFVLGGDSLLAAELVAAVGDAFGAEVEPAALLGAATVAEMAALLEQADRGTTDSA